MHGRYALGLVVAVLALPASAPAATTIGSDLAAEPTGSCLDGGAGAYNDCSLAPLDGAAFTVPSAGVITRWSLKHGPNPGGTIPYASLRVLSPGADPATFATSPLGAVSPSGTAGVDTFTVNPGIAVAAGQRIGVYVYDAGLKVLAPGGQSGWVTGSANGTQTYKPVAGTLLLQAVVEPDADGDGLGDETQDTSAAPGSTTPPGGGDSGGGGTIPVYTAKGIDEFRAAPIGIYHAAEIKRLPATTNLYDAVMKGWSQPIRCSLACQITTAATMRGISASLYAMMARTRVVVVGKAAGSFPTAGTGKLPLRLTAKARRALKRYGRTVRITLQTTVKDGRATVVHRQTITVKATKKR